MVQATIDKAWVESENWCGDCATPEEHKERIRMEQESQGGSFPADSTEAGRDQREMQEDQEPNVEEFPHEEDDDGEVNN